MNLIKEAIYTLINLEKELGRKCYLLTELGLSHSDPEVFETCERIREEIVDSNQEGISSGGGEDPVPCEEGNGDEDSFGEEDAIGAL